MFSDPFHDPVMAREIFGFMDLEPGMVYVDGTLGLGGHALKAAELLYPGGTIVGLDWDEKMLLVAKERLSSVTGVRIEIVRSDFRNMSEILSNLGLMANGILLDLGLNSAQVDDPERGFSFQTDGPLDMRMDRAKGETASSLLNSLSLYEIESILHEYGDERWARAISIKILERRKDNPLRTTKDLVQCVLDAVPAGARDTRIHPATRTFQAIRIATNHEFGGLSNAITNATEHLAPGGVLIVLSYHSGEDRIVKNTFKELDRERFTELTKKPLTPTPSEILVNRRARSARLRAIKRIGSKL